MIREFRAIEFFSGYVVNGFLYNNLFYKNLSKNNRFIHLLNSFSNAEYSMDGNPKFPLRGFKKLEKGEQWDISS